MKKLIYLLSITLFSQQLISQTYTVPVSGSNSITANSGIVYDNGQSLNYNNNSNGTLTINPTLTGSYIHLDFTSFNVETCCDFLRIYDGTSATDPLIGTFTSNPGNVYASNSTGALTLVFTSNSSTNYGGFEANISTVSVIPAPDLIVVNASIGSNTIMKGISSSLSYTLKNIGGSNASSITTGFYLSTNTTWDSNDLLLSSQNNNALSSAQELNQSSSIIIPTSVVSGSYYVLFFTDNNSLINEGNEANNINRFLITVVDSGIDLLTSSISTSLSSLSPGGLFTATSYTNNNGNVVSSISSLGYYLSSDLTFDSTDIYLSSLTISTINSGNSVYSTSSLTVPNNTLPGNYFLLFVSDYLNTNIESNEQNNVNARPLSVIESVTDITVLSTSTNLSITPGSSVSLSYILANQSSQYNTIPSGFYLSTDSIFDIQDAYLSNYSNYMSAYDIYTYSINLLIPANTVPGNYFIITFGDYTNSIVETSENNNIYSTPISILTPQIDLLTQTQTLSASSTVAGNSVSTSCYIKNFGNTASTSSNVGFYLSNDTIFDANDQYLNYSAGYTLGSMGSSYRSSTLTIPSSTLIGNYYILFFSDYSNQITETNEINNVSFLPISIETGFIDLVITNQTNNSVCTQGSSISTTCTISNTGNITSNSSSIGYYLSLDTLFDANDTYLNYYNGYSIAAGGANLRNLNLTIPSSTPIGNYFVLYFADYTFLITESNESNNLKYFPLNVTTPSIDLSLNSPTNPLTSSPSNTISVGVTILNNGSISSSSSNIGCYLSTDTIFDANDFYLTVNAGGTLASGTTNDRTFSLTIPSTTTYGNYFILYFADYTNLVNETNELNNISYSPIEIGLFPNTNYVVPFSGSNTITTCSGIVYDHAQNSDYSNGANGTLIINPGTVGSYVKLNFSSLSVESCCDRLSIYNGTSTSSPLIGTYTSNPGIVYASNSLGALTLVFTSDGSVIASGFQATISCVSSIPLPDLIVQDGNTVSPVNIVSGGSITAVCTIGNIGESNSSASNIAYYLSNDSILDVNDLYLSNTTVSNILANGTLPKTFNLTIPQSTTPGNYYLIYYVDYLNSLSEISDTNNTNWNVFTVSAAYYDLSINTPISTSNLSNVVAGSNVSLYCNYQNNGNVTVSYPTIGYYLSVDSLFDLSDTYLAYSTSTSITPSNSVTNSSNVLIPISTPAGNYYIIYFADYLNSFIENNELNNTIFIPISVVPQQVDLTIVNNYLLTNTVAVGSTLNVSCKIFNQGNSSSQYSNVGYYLSTDESLDINDVYLNNSLGNTINANGFATKTSILTIPSGTLPGNYYILFYADYSNLVNEVNEINNVSSSRITITTLSIDLSTLSPFTALSNYMVGSSINLSYTIYNSGSASSNSSNVGYYLSSDTIFDNSDTYLSNYSGSLLSANGSSFRNSNITIPTITTPGNYYLLIYADQTNLVTENNENNNVSYLKIMIYPSIVDLFIVSPSLSDATFLTAGSAISSSCIIYNQGNTSSNSSSIGYYLSSDNIWSQSDILLANISGGILTANMSATRSTSLTIPSSTANGNYYILYFADNSLNVTEVNESNNVFAIPVSVGNSFIDITVTNMLLSTNTTFPGSTITVNLQINNWGTLSSSACYAGIYLSNDDVWDISDTYLDYSSLSGISPNSSILNVVDITIPSTTINGAYYLIIYGDFLNNVSESVETNNVNFLPISVGSSYIDLTSSNLTLSTNITFPGSSVNANYQVNNLGSLNSSDFYVGYYLSNDDVWDISDINLGSSNISGIDSYSSMINSEDIIIPNSTIDGSYYLLLYTDYLNNNSESIESNNVISLPIIIGNSFVDLGISNMILSANSTLSGSIINVSYQINNLGTLGTSDFYVGYYLSNDNVWDISDVNLGYSTISGVDPNSSLTYDKDISIPTNSASGFYYVILYSDVFNSVSESIESNNTLSATITLQQTSSISEIDNKNAVNISVYPNPASDFLIITSINIFAADLIDVEIKDVTGKKIYSEITPITEGEFKSKIDLKNISPGAYFVDVVVDGIKYSNKVIIK